MEHPVARRIRALAAIRRRITNVLVPVSILTLALSPSVADNVDLQIQKGPSAGQITLSWTGGSPPLSVYRAASPAAVESPANLIGTVNGPPWIETPPADPQLFYLVVPSSAPVCGNGTRESGEQCDDGNLVNLDGCDAACRFEQAQRATWFKMQFTTGTFCTQNQLGSAIAPFAQSMIQGAIDNDVADGSFSVVLAAQNPLTDLGGINEPSFQLGFLSGVPVLPGSSTYNGTNDLDWWYTVGPLGPGRVPANLLSANIAARTLNAGPGRVVLPNILDASAPPLVFAAAKVRIQTGASSTPLSSVTGLPPGHLPTENLDPLLASYATCGTTAAPGDLCGRVVAASLKTTPITPSLLSNCTTPVFTSANSMLDVLVSGCRALFGTIVVIIARQPDVSDPDVPVAGAGPPYTFQFDATTRIVNGCRDHNNVTVDLATCLNSAAYSSYFKLATDRVIPK